MSIAYEVRKLVLVLDQKAEVEDQCWDAKLAGDKAKIKFIEQYMYPSLNQHIRDQIERVNKLWNIKDERTKYADQQAV